MDLLIFDLWWMSYNVSLALVAIVFGNLMLNTKIRIGKIFFGVIWLLFIPNTLYMLTDIYHLWDDWYKTTLFFDIVLIPVYVALFTLGIITFIYAIKPFENLLKKDNITKKYASLIIFATNFLIAFGIVLGRIQRLNSWEAITNVPKVIQESVSILVSFESFLYVIGVGIIANVVFILYKKKKLRFINIL